MGDIKRFKKKFSKPMHPWNATRIQLEKDIKRKYGIPRKQEIWKMESKLKDLKDQVKKLLVRTDVQANKEREQLRARLVALGLIKITGSEDDVLGLQLKDIMDRRLQTLVLKRKMARSVVHARQMIVHEHIMVGGKKVTSPAYLVPAADEATITFAPDSAYMQSDHPEAYNEEMARKRHDAHKRDDRSNEESIIVFDEAAIADPEIKEAP